MRNLLRSSRRELQGRNPLIEDCEAPHGRLRGARRRFSPDGFPLHVMDFGLSHHPSIHTHRRWGNIDSRGTVADRDHRGGDHTGFEGVNRGGTSTGTNALCMTQLPD